MKRVIDLLLVILFVPLYIPCIFLVALTVRLYLGAPVLYKQVRPGLDGKKFDLYKFRSMSDCRDQTGELLADELRLGKFGSLLRSTSLDELPSVWNVFIGDMSFVGPRPLLVEYLQHYDNVQVRRHDVRPGITGWAQVNGRNTISWEEKFALDVWYVDNRSIWLDFKILFLTIKKVLAREGISSGDNVTMEKFRG